MYYWKHSYCSFC